MSRVVLIGWNAAEADARAALLRKAGHLARVHVPGSGAGLRSLWQSPPDLFVIDLDRRPSEGCVIAAMLRQRKKTRRVPIVFAGGEPANVARARRVLPDAVFAPWSRMRGAPRRALVNRPADPVVPDSILAGYSGTPLPKKLGIRPGLSLALLGVPAGFEERLGALADGVCVVRRAGARADLLLLFARSRADLDRRLPPAMRGMAEGGSIWIAWPKQVSGVSSDLTQAHVRAAGLAADLVDYKICAIDSTWSGLRFARRRPK